MEIQLDIYDDTELEKLQGVTLPDFVKQGEVKKPENCDRFAANIITKTGSVTNKFPIDDKASTWVSGLYFNKNKENLSKEATEKIAANIKQAAERFDILENMPVSIQSAEAEASNNRLEKESAIDPAVAPEPEPQNYALPEKKKYPLDSEGQVKEAAEYFDSYKNEMAYSDRINYAENLVKRANELEVTIEGEAEKYATDLSASDEALKLALDARKEYVDQEDHEALDVIFEKRSSLGKETLEGLIHEFDKKAGVKQHWGKHFPDPRKTVNSDDPSKMKKTAASATYQGKSISGDDIQNISGEKLKEYFSDEQVEELQQNPIEVFRALPDPHKEIIRDLIPDGN